MHELTQSQTSEPLLFLMIDSALHINGKTGLSPTVTISKNGASFASPAGAVTELANGWYKVAGNATDTDTLGPLILHAEASGADPVDDRYQVVKQNRRTASMDLLLAKTTNLSGLNDVAATDIVSAGAITTASGKVSGVGTTDNVTLLAATALDSITATEPTAKPTTFTTKLMWLVQRFWRADKTPTLLTVKTEAGATVTSQVLTDNTAGNETLGKPT